MRSVENVFTEDFTREETAHVDDCLCFTRQKKKGAKSGKKKKKEKDLTADR